MQRGRLRGRCTWCQRRTSGLPLWLPRTAPRSPSAASSSSPVLTVEVVHDRLVAAAFQAAMSDGDFQLMADLGHHQSHLLE